MYYIMLFLIMLSGCATTMSPTDVGDYSPKPSIENVVVKQPETTPKPPDWVLHKEHAGFNNVQYLVGIGFSDKNTVSASESARAELTKNIRFKIHAVMKDYSSNDGSFVESFVETETDFLLEGVQIKDGWYDPSKKVYYSLAVVKRKDVLSMIQDQIDNLIASIVLLQKQADTFYDNGEVLKSLVYYYDGYNESSKLLPYLRTYKTVNLFPEAPSLPKNIPSLNDFKEKIKFIVSNIEIQKFYEDYNIISNKDITFTVKVVFNENPIKNLPVKFNGSSYNFLSKILTDSNGIAKTTTTSSVIFDENNLALVKAKIDLRRLSQQFNYKLNKELFGRLETLEVNYKLVKPITFNFSTSKDRVKVGNNIVFVVESDISGYLVIKYLNDKIFPNYMMKDNYIEKNKSYNIGGVGYDFEFSIKPPIGKESVTATLYKEVGLKTVLAKHTVSYDVVKGD